MEGPPEKFTELHDLMGGLFVSYPNGSQHYTFIGRTDVEAEVAIFWPLDAKSRLIGKDPDAGKDGRREEKGATQDEMAGWHHRRDRHEFG